MSKILTSLKNNASIIESALKDYLKSYDSSCGILYDAMRYAVLGGGKRIRPFLTLEFCRLYGGRDEAAIPFASAIEMIHTYSLIHDDLPCMDNDDFRRGKPTVHKKYGEAYALLAGDALLTYAFEVAASNKAVPPEAALEAVRVLAANAGAEGMVGGQLIDLTGENALLDYETLLHMNSLKTGKLIEAACRLGCIAAGHRDTETAAFYAGRVGMAFQIIDDILDDGSEDNKTTFLKFMSREQATQTAERLTFEACEILKDVEGSDTLSSLALYLLDRKN